MIFKLFDKFNSGDNMKQKILCILTVFLLPLLFASCDESPKEVEYTHDYDSDEAAIKAICEKRGAECGEITVRIEDKLGKVNCGECNSGFVCDEIANKCTDSSDTDDPQDDSDVTESDTDNFQEDSDIPHSRIRHDHHPYLFRHNQKDETGITKIQIKKKKTLALITF